MKHLSVPKSLLKPLREAKEQASFRRNLERRLRAENGREARIALRYREKLIEQGMRHAGIDTAKLQARQRKADELRDAKYKSLAKEVLRNARHTKQRQARWLKRTIDHHGGGAGPQPFDFGILESANATKIDQKGQSKNAATSVAPQQNLLTFRWDFTNRYDLSEAWVDATFDFILMPSQGGSLQVFAPVIYMGSWFWNTFGACHGTSGTHFESGVVLTIMQNQPGGVVSSESVGIPAFTLFEQGSTCLGGVGMVPIDDTLIVQPPPLPVVAELPVVISVLVSLDADLWGAHDIVDFASEDNHINVAGVLFGIS